MLMLALAACDMGGDAGGPPPGPPTAWVSINSHEPQGDIVTAGSVTLWGSAYCDNCPSDEVAVGYCPAEKPSPPTAINVTVLNRTTGKSAGMIGNEIGGECACLFSYCMMVYANRWAAYYVPLTWGENVIVATASGPGFDPGRDSITITRVPGTVGNPKAISGKQQVTLSWDPVPDATSYNIYWSTSRDVSKATGTMIAGVTSPYIQTGLVDGQTYYYIVTSVRDGGESLPSSIVAATPGWVVESVAPTAGWTITSIATDSAGNAHIHYANVVSTGTAYSFQSYYVTNETGAWSSLPVDQSLGPYGPYDVDVDVALDSQNTVHVSVVNSAGLTHATYASGAWLREVVDPSARCEASLVLDAANKAHVAYFTPTSLRYATNTSGAWANVVIEEFGGSLNCGQRTHGSVSLSVDASGTTHIAYRGIGNAVMYATNQGGAWTVSSHIPANNGSALAVDPRGAVHMVYSNQYTNNVSGTWIDETIQGPSLYNPSLSLDAAGNAHVIYTNTAPYEVRYASNSSGTWHITTLESVSPYSPEDMDIALDSQGKVHISYPNSGLRSATNK